jgi:hypothetical protein
MTDEEKAKTTDYNKSSKKGELKAPPEKHIEKVVTSEVVVQKKTIGSKVKDIFVAADFKSVMNYVMYDVLIPAARNMIVDSATKGVERMFFGESRFRRPPGPLSRGSMSRYTYQTPVTREREGYRDPRTNPPMGNSFPRTGRPDFFLQSRQEADSVLDAMYDTLNVYEVVSVGDLNTLVGLPAAHTDEKWGWTDLRGVEVRQERAGWVIDLPKAEPI